jgi:large conductance mechanosensitive channel
MGFLNDFKTFAVKGNLADLAIGVVIGASFGKVISAFIDGMVLPLVGIITGKDFSNMYFGLNDATRAAAATGTASLAEAQKLGPVFAYGSFISAVINFLIIALVCYMVIKNLLKKDPNAVPAPTATETLLTEIRDGLRK